MRKTSRRFAPLALTVALLGALLAAAPVSAQNEGGGVPAETTGSAVNEVTGQIERAYITMLGRRPDVGGQRFWLAQYAAGMPLETIYAHFLASPERQSKYPSGQSDAEFLTQLYLDAFGRAPDAGGLEFWSGQLAAGMTRVRVISFFADSLEQRTNTAAASDFELSILHINDHHSHLQSDSGDILLDGVSTRVELGGFSRVVAKIDELETELAGTNVTKVHAGDAITGTLFYSLFEGEADAAMMNEVCFDVFALGNHEFDGGDAGLKVFLDFLADSSTCATEVLAANVIPEVGTPLAPVTSTDYFEPYRVIDYPDGSVGYVGIDIAAKTMNSSSPLDTTQFLDEVETAQKYVDELQDMGIDKIVLVTHYQYENDIALASMVDGVDVIIGGDSHTLLGDFDEFGLSTGGAYPTAVTDKSGRPVCIAQAWQYSAVVGELSVSFDEYGHVASCEGTPHLLIGETLQRRPEPGADREPITGAELDAAMAVIDAAEQISVVTPDADAEAILATFAADVDTLAAQAIGTASEDLCLERIPGQGRSSIVGCAELTAVNGGDIQQLVAHAFRDQSFESDIALQNAGGVRIDIPAGDFSIADAYELLPFANTLVNLEMTGAQIKATVEEGVENAVRPDGSTGAYPYAAGLRWDMDLTQPAGSRASNLEYQAKGSTEWVPLDMAATYTVVTNSFQASGGDGYDTMGEIFDAGDYVDTFLDYAKTFIDYVEAQPAGAGGLPVINKVPVDEYSTQSFVPLPG